MAARADAWSAQLAARRVAVDVRVPAGTTALATPGAVEQVLDNLISNALAVSPHGSVLRIHTTSTIGGIELHVVDEGSGMTPGQRARAFDRFWRAGPPGSGTGLGLAVVHRLVTTDGGTVELRQAVGGGLDASIRLRRAPSPNLNPPLVRA